MKPAEAGCVVLGDRRLPAFVPLVPMALVLCLLCACGTVRPGADYDRAGAEIRAHTGANQVYDPEEDTLVKGKVDRLLEGGLTAEEAVSVALLNNAAFQSKFLEIGASRADVVQSGLLANPAMALSARPPIGGGRANLTFSLAEELVDLWQIPVRKKTARKELDKTIASVVNEAVTLRADARKAYFKLLAAQESLAVAKENEDLLRHSLELAQHRFDAGEATVLDVRLVQANLLEIEVKKATLEQQVESARIDLARVLGLARSEIDWNLSDKLPEPVALVPDDKALLARAADQRLDLQMASLDVAQAEDEVAKQFRSIVPSVTAGVEVERSELRGPASRPYAPLENIEIVKGPGYTPQDAKLDVIHGVGNYLRDRLAAKRDREFEEQQTINVLLGPTLDITLPVFDQNRAQIAKARIRVFQKRKDYEDKLDEAAKDVLTAASALRNAHRIVQLTRDQGLPQAQAALETAERVYEAGEESVVALTAAEEALIQQREAYQTALGDYAAALADLERAVGGQIDGQPAAPREAAHD